MKHGGGSGSDGENSNKDQIRRIFERIFNTNGGGSSSSEDGRKKLKNKQAKYFFKRWLEFEEKVGDERRVDAVKLRAAEWVKNAGPL